MEFVEHFYGIKITGSFVAIEPADQFGELSKYDFAITDRLVEDYNGNSSYATTITPLGKDKEVMVNGWKLKSISFWGNWFGNYGTCDLEDAFGKEISIDGCGRTKWYIDQSQIMLRTCLQSFVNFAAENYSVEYYKLMDKKLPSQIKGKLSDIHNQLKEITDYLERYNSVCEELQNNEDNREYINNLKRTVSQKLSKILNTDIPAL